MKSGTGEATGFGGGRFQITVLFGLHTTDDEDHGRVRDRDRWDKQTRRGCPRRDADTGDAHTFVVVFRRFLANLAMNGVIFDFADYRLSEWRIHESS